MGDRRRCRCRCRKSELITAVNSAARAHYVGQPAVVRSTPEEVTISTSYSSTLSSQAIAVAPRAAAAVAYTSAHSRAGPGGGTARVVGAGPAGCGAVVWG